MTGKQNRLAVLFVIIQMKKKKEKNKSQVYGNYFVAYMLANVVVSPERRAFVQLLPAEVLACHFQDELACLKSQLQSELVKAR